LKKLLTLRPSRLLLSRPRRKNRNPLPQDFLSACLDSAGALAPLVASGEASETAGSVSSSRLASLTLSTLGLLTSPNGDGDGGGSTTGARRAAETPALGRLLARLVAVVLPQHLPATLRGSVEALEKAAAAAAAEEERGDGGSRGASSSSTSSYSPSACAARAALEVLSAGLSSLGRIYVAPGKRFIVYTENGEGEEATGSGGDEGEGGAGGGGAGNQPMAIDEDASFDPLELQAAVVSRVLALRRWPAPPSVVVGALRAAPLLSAEQAMALAARALRTASAASAAAASGSPPSSRSSPPPPASSFADVAPLARQVLLLRPSRAAGAALLGLARVLDGLFAFEAKNASSSSSAAAAAAAAAASDAAAAVLLEVELAAKSGGVPEAAAVAWTRSLASRASPSPGGAALLLTLAGVPRLASQAVEETARALSGAFRAEAVAAGSRWAARLPALPLPAARDLEEALVGAVSCGGGRLLGSALALAGVLLDGAPLVAASAVLGADGDDDDDEGGAEAADEEEARKEKAASSSSSSLRSSPNLPPDERGARLGARVLVAAYGASRLSRGDVLRLLCGRLAASAGGWAADGGGGRGGGHGSCESAARGVPHCIAALGEIARGHPEDLGGAHADALREALALAGALPAAAGGIALLSALWPAARRSRGARDAAALALRKAAFSREPAARATAARGLLMTASAEARAASLALEEARERAAAAAAAAVAARARARAGADGNDGGDPGPSQQAAPSQQPFPAAEEAAAAVAAAQAQAFHFQQSAASSATAAQELGGLLRRALAQQEAVRIAVYGSAPSLVRADVASSVSSTTATTTTSTLASLLAPHLEKFVGDGTPRGGAPLRLDLAIVPVAGSGALSSSAAAAALEADDVDEEAGAPSAAAAAAGAASSSSAAGIRIVEPLAALLSCARLSVLAARGRHVGSAAAPVAAGAEEGEASANRRSDPVSSLSLAFARARDGVLASVPEDYGLDKTAGLGDNGGRAATCPTLGAARAGALAACLEVLMEDAAAAALSADEPADSAATKVSAAFKVHERLRRMLLQLLVASTASTTGSAGGGGSSSSLGAAAAAVGSKRGRDGGSSSSSSTSAPASFALRALLRSHLSAGAIAAFLDALVEDGMKPKARFVPPPNRNGSASGTGGDGSAGGDGAAAAAAGATSPSLGEGARLARDKHFQAFVLRSATALLLSSQSSFAASPSTATSSNNSNSNPAARAAAAAAAASSPWARRARAVLARPLLRAAGMIVSAYAGTRGGGAAAAGGGGSGGGGASASVAAALLGGSNGVPNPAATAALLAGDSTESLVMLAVQSIGVLLKGAALGGDLREVLESAGEEEEEDDEEMNDGDGDNGKRRGRHQRTWLPLAARLVERLSDNACWKELEALATVLTGVTARIGGAAGGNSSAADAADAAGCCCAPLAAAARQALSSRELSHGPAVRSLVALLVSASRPERGEDLEAAHDVSRAVAEVLAVAATTNPGGDGAAASVAAAAAAASEALPAINSRTLPAAAGALAEALTAALTDVAWALARTREAVGNAQGGSGSGGGGGEKAAPSAAAAAAAAAASAAAADASCDRLRGLLAPLAELARASGLSVRAPRAGDRTLLAIRAAYRALTAAAKLAGIMTAAAAAAAATGSGANPSSSLSAAARPALRPAFSALVADVHETLGPAAQGMILDSENTAAVTAGSGGGGGGGGVAPATATAAAAKISNAAAASNGARAPEIVFAAEAFDAALIKLGAATRANLMRGARRAMARDFRITLNDSTTTMTGGGGGRGCTPATGNRGGNSSAGAARHPARDTPLAETKANGERI